MGEEGGLGERGIHLLWLGGKKWYKGRGAIIRRFTTLGGWTEEKKVLSPNRGKAAEVWTADQTVPSRPKIRHYTGKKRKNFGSTDTQSGGNESAGQKKKFKREEEKGNGSSRFHERDRRDLPLVVSTFSEKKKITMNLAKEG